MEQLINITDAVFLGHVGEVELGASAIAGIYYLAVYMLGFGFSIGDLSSGSPLFRLAQLRAVILISFSGYPVFFRWNNAHKSFIGIGCYCGGD